MLGEQMEAEQPTAPAKDLPLPSELFHVKGRPAFLIPPGKPAHAKPWVWYAPTLPGLPGPEERWMFEQFTDAGLAIAGVDVGESFGSPTGRALYAAFHDELVRNRGLRNKPCLLARSRGGPMLYNWAVEHPESVAGIAGIYPVCDLRSYPGLSSACSAYGMAEEQLEAQLSEHNPLDRVEPLAKAGVPIFHVHGDSDSVVPLDQNSAALAKRYGEHGGSMTLLVIKGRGHDMWHGWFQCRELVEFVIAKATRNQASAADAPRSTTEVTNATAHHCEP